MTPPHAALDVPFRLVEKPDAFDAMMERLRGAPILGIDTESNSLHAYFERVCLIQISLPDIDFIIDPLALKDLRALEEVLGNPAQEKVFHGADYDIGTMRRDFGFTFENVFDTMLACRLLGIKRFGLANLLEERLGVHLDKKMQRYNWGRRPLDRDALDYARLDSHYLIPLRHQLFDELRARRKEAQAREVFTRVAGAEWHRPPFDPEGFWHIQGAHSLDPAGLGVLREVYLWRDAMARRQDRPPFRVLSNTALLEISRRRPKTLEELEDIPGMSVHLRRRYASDLLRAVARGVQSPISSPPKNGSGPRFTWEEKERFERLRAWRAGYAQRRDEETDILISNRILKSIAQAVPRTVEELRAVEEISDYLIEHYGEEILRALRGR